MYDIEYLLVEYAMMCHRRPVTSLLQLQVTSGCITDPVSSATEDSYGSDVN